MAAIRLTKEFSFEMAHTLAGYDGPCREIHGHSYKLFVTVKGEPVADARVHEQQSGCGGVAVRLPVEARSGDLEMRHGDTVGPAHRGCNDS